MESREQYIRPYLEEANRIYDEMIDELVSIVTGKQIGRAHV